jgi:hypothetical protein
MAYKHLSTSIPDSVTMVHTKEGLARDTPIPDVIAIHEEEPL